MAETHEANAAALTDLRMFRVSTNTLRYRGYSNVTFHWFVKERPQNLFGMGGVVNIAYSDVIKAYDPGSEYYTGPYSERALEEHYTVDELVQFVRYLASNGSVPDQHVIHEISFPIGNALRGLGATAWGGKLGCYNLFEREGYDLSVKVAGYYDLSKCTFDADAQSDRWRD
jgi:hypothetical protein